MANGTVYGLGILLDAMREALLADSMLPHGSATAAAPKAESFSMSRRSRPCFSDIEMSPRSIPADRFAAMSLLSGRRLPSQGVITKPLPGGSNPPTSWGFAPITLGSRDPM